MLHQRARPLLGTLVLLRVLDPDPARAQQAMDAAFAELARVDQLMSAHRPGSELHRLAQARPGDTLALHPHTARVLALAQHWQRESGGLFDPLRAGLALARRGLRPALEAALQQPIASWAGLQWREPGVLRVDGALALDFGGIAKGYAVDCALACLRQAGLDGALVNAGGDLAAFGPRAWPIELRAEASPTRTRRQAGLSRLREGALASSAAPPQRPDWWWARRGPRRGEGAPRACSVLARDCVTADVLTKWVLQAPEAALRGRLARVLRAQRARVWLA